MLVGGFLYIFFGARAPSCLLRKQECPCYVGATDGTQFYHFRLDHGVKASSQLLRWPDKNSAVAPPAKHETEAKDGQAYRLRVTVSGEKMIGYVDSVKQFEYDAQRGGAV